MARPRPGPATEPWARARRPTRTRPGPGRAVRRAVGLRIDWEPDPGLAGFAAGGVWDSAPPSAALAAALEGAAGEGRRCEGGSRGEIVGAVRAAAALESWACAFKLGLIRAAIRQDDDGLGGAYHGDLPDGWSRSLTTDIALALAMSPVSAEKLMQTAWDLGALLPGIGALLEDGTLTYPKARAVNDALELLGEEDKAAAEAMIVPLVAGKTFGQVDKIAAQAAVTVDPGLAERTREHAERNRARVVLQAGAVRRGEPVRLRPAAGRDAGRARRDLRPRGALQGLRRVPGGFHGPAAGDGVPGFDERDQRGGADRGGPAGRRAGRAGGERVPGRAGAGRSGRARAGRQRRVGLPVRRVRRQMLAPR